ncbi:hypothetical protein Vretimale_968 [Volvox reticuliferus]|uniref:Uncharacterized protein n=1 Tax=Volvox reticuliferus TaxID=1737510 RepID=A0A8J4FQ78_9CHLO|nr:hypothetical protein Vretifemale_10526 [Volvox reticuliferus]GIL94880.1 hypothetical protein Vretimale_968 [Volvox reticuliferus]
MASVNITSQQGRCSIVFNERRPKRPIAISSRPRSLSGPTVSEKDYQRDPELQAAIDSLFADTVHKDRTRLHRADIQHHIDRIVALGSRLGLNRVHPQWNIGTFKPLITTNTTGVTMDEVCTLQRFTFGQVRPSDLKVELGDSLQIRGPIPGVEGSAANSYMLENYFKFLESGLLGIMTPEGVYDTSEEEPGRLGVTFCGFKIRPVRTETQSLSLWRELLAEHNPSMDDEGVISFTFPKPLSATLNYIVMEPDLHMSLGGSGDLLVVQRRQPM